MPTLTRQQYKPTQQQHPRLVSRFHALSRKSQVKKGPTSGIGIAKNNQGLGTGDKTPQIPGWKRGALVLFRVFVSPPPPPHVPSCALHASSGAEEVKGSTIVSLAVYIVEGMSGHFPTTNPLRRWFGCPPPVFLSPIVSSFFFFFFLALAFNNLSLVVIYLPCGFRSLITRIASHTSAT